MFGDEFTNDRSDYACFAVPIGTGGFAVAYRATHKPTGARVVLKSLKDKWGEEARGRMRREVDVMSQLAGDKHLMQVLAYDEDFKWYVMPEAEGSLEALVDEVNTDEELRDLVVDVAAGLTTAHDEDFVHRDVTPGNVLRMGGSDPRWVLSDFGLVRRPSGQTTTLYTGTGSNFGTFGYVAPELLQNPHADASVKSDVFALARVLQFAATGVMPLPGDFDAPEEAGVFRRAIRRAINPDPKQRSTLEDFVKAVVRAAEPLAGPSSTVAELTQLASTGDARAAAELYDIAEDTPDDPGIFIDSIPQVGARTVWELAALRPKQSLGIARRMNWHLRENFERRDFNYANVPLRWMENVARGAVSAENMPLLEDVVEVLFEADVSWNRFRQRDRTRTWLAGLQGDEAAVVARVLRDNPAAVEYYQDGGWSLGPVADQALRGVLG